MIKKKLVNINQKTCPFCSGNTARVYSGLQDRLDTVKGSYSIDECQSCSLAFTNPLPVKNLDILYPSNYLIPEKKTRFDIFKWYRFDQYHYDYKLFQRATGLKPSDIKSSLDIGCGSGDRVEYLELNGVKKSEGLDKYDNMHGQHPPHIVNTEILSYFPKQKYQLISLFHVLEHLDDPKKHLQHISKKILDKNGFLIIQVPNYDAFERKVFKNRWFPFDVPRHLWHFNEESLTNILEETGFSIKAIYKKNAFLHPVSIAPSIIKNADPQVVWNKKKSSKFLYLIIWALLTIVTIPISIVLSIFKQGSMLTLVAINNR